MTQEKDSMPDAAERILEAVMFESWLRFSFLEELPEEGPDGGPRLRIFSCCTNLVRALPLLRFDAHDAEDVADGCEDHAPEALRYALMSRPAPARPAPPPRPRPAYDPFAAPAPARRGFEGA